jgi:hypothetical protein
MKAWFGWLIASCVVVVGGSMAWNYRHRVVLPAADMYAQPQANYTEAQEAQRMVEVTGPMADYMRGKSAIQIETLQPVAQRKSELDRVGETPVGTSRVLVQQSFTIAKAVDVPFELPPHAATPQLRGSYHAYLQAGGAASPDDANVEFLLFTEQQFADFLSGRPGDALFSADGAHDEDVNFSLPPTYTKPAKYFLVFRNESPKPAKRIVQADFKVEF